MMLHLVRSTDGLQRCADLFSEGDGLVLMEGLVNYDLDVTDFEAVGQVHTLGQSLSYEQLVELVVQYERHFTYGV